MGSRFNPMTEGDSVIELKHHDDAPVVPFGPGGQSSGRSRTATGWSCGRARVDLGWPSRCTCRTRTSKVCGLGARSTACSGDSEARGLRGDWSVRACLDRVAAPGVRCMISTD